ncbi:PEST proteolytic signal-containing nuclear protein-like [Hetaerina americana]|uniref:PEST proteolytic signal-containing nuclear protein-like n=1 Tax=Hetaerina americana TaxID=62018 RepID=UPI003A7F4FA0
MATAEVRQSKRRSEDSAELDASRKVQKDAEPDRKTIKLSAPIAPVGTVKKGIQIKLNAQNPSPPKVTSKPKSTSVAAAFCQDDDDEPEEMPPEARMRMRNIGRDTPTSTGPNSFGKTKKGFCDTKKMFEKTLNRTAEQQGNANN